MKNFKKTLLATTAALSIISFSAQASEGKQEWAYKKEESTASSKFYVTGGAAYVKGKIKGYTTASSNKSHSFNSVEFNLGAGYYLNDNVRADLNLNYMPKTEITSGVDVKTKGVMVNGYYHLPIGSESFSPYTTVGLGYTKNKIFANNTNYKANNFAWQIGGGISGPISEKLFWDVGYRYTDKGKAAKSSSFPAGVTSSSLTSHSVLFSVRASL